MNHDAMNDDVMNDDTMKRFRCAAIQMNSTDDVAKNLRHAAAAIADAAGDGALLIVLPETFAFIGREQRDQLALREPQGRGPIQDFLAEQAVRHGVWLIGGTLPLASPDDERAYAVSPLVAANGKTVAAYRKIHLFDVDLPEQNQRYRESAAYKPGTEPVLADTPFGRVALSVCYDLRFPELFRLLAARGAEIIALPSAFTAATGAAHWKTLLRARAIENQAWVIAANQSGTHANGKSCYGHSSVVDFWGVVRAAAAGGESVVSAVIDRAEQHRLRCSFPCLEHRVFK